MKTPSTVLLFIKLSVLLTLLYISCSDQTEKGEQKSGSTTIQILPLQGEIAAKKSEISGLAWYKEQLIILPQYPDRFSKNGAAALFRIPKEDLLAYIDGKTKEEFDPVRIEFDDRSIGDSIDGFQGYEAIQFNGNKVYLLIEADNDGVMSAYVVEGSLGEEPYRLDLDPSSLRSLTMPVNLDNFAYESLVIAGDTLFSFYEANGININPEAYAIGYNIQTGDTLIVPFPTIEYRITDATSLDEKNNLWVINYFWPGESQILSPGTDSLLIRSDSTVYFSNSGSVERLLELHFTGSRFELTQTDPIYLSQDSKGESRNWEGIVKLDDIGFVIATDKHPRTILAFVSRDKN